MPTLLGPRSLRTLRRAGFFETLKPTPAMLRLLFDAPFRNSNLGTAVRLHTAATPDRIAMIDDGGALTWARLDERVSRLAHVFLERAGEGARVAFILRNGRENVECYCACGRAGLAAVPVNTWSTAAELKHVLSTQKAALLVADREFAGVVEDAGEPVDVLWVGRDDGYEEALHQSDPRPPAVKGGGRIITHTSGTTGKPKGAEREVGGQALPQLVGLLDKVPLKASDRFMIASPLFHQLGQGMLSIALVMGNTTLLSRKFEPAESLERMGAQQVTVACLVPVMLQRIADLAGDVRVPSLRILIVSGAALPATTRERAEKKLGRIIYDLYGATEVGWAAIATPDDQVRKPGSVGKPGRGMDVFATDADGRRLKPGEMGTIFVDAGFGFEGYTGGAQDRRRLGTAISIGDTGFIDEDGYVYISGRDDDMIVSGGENIYPSEVEAALDEMPELTEAAVIGVDDEEYGQVLHAICVKRAGARVDEAAVIEHVRQRLSRYKAPKRVTFIDELPRNSTGKVLKRELQLIVAATRGDDGRAVRPGRRPRRVPAGKDKA